MDKEDYSSDEDDDQNKYLMGKGETIADEQKRLKNEFKLAAKKEDFEEESEDADAMFTTKKKSILQIENENKEYEKFMNKMKTKKQKKGKE